MMYSDLHKDNEVKLELPLSEHIGNKVTKDGKIKKVYRHFAPSLNEIIAKSRNRLSRGIDVWGVYKRELTADIIKRFRTQTNVRYEEPVAISFQRYAVRLLDWDSVGASFKCIGDSLVEAGIIGDDDPNHIVKFFPEQYKVKTKAEEKIIIHIWEFK